MNEKDWKELRVKYFDECVNIYTAPGIYKIQVNLAPHDLFEWFKKEINEKI